jgi:hypothetical protein
MKTIAVAGLLITLGFPAAGLRAAEPRRGVTDAEIIIGTTTDLSGVTAVQGVNSAGGINGRKIHYVVEIPNTRFRAPCRRSPS